MDSISRLLTVTQPLFTFTATDKLLVSVNFGKQSKWADWRRGRPSISKNRTKCIYYWKRLKWDAEACLQQLRMSKKCILVVHRSHKYVLSCQDLTKIIARQRRQAPRIPIFKIAVPESCQIEDSIDSNSSSYIVSALSH